jgi:CheY-like chemotaxis protein
VFIEGCSPPAGPAVPATGQVEILLLADDPDEAGLAQEALQGSGVPSRLHVLGDAREALAFLRREGAHALAPRPNLLILALPLTHPGALRVLLEIKSNRDLRGVPVIVVSNAEGAEEFLHAHSLPINLRVRRPEDLPAFERLVDSAHELCLTVVQLYHA